MAKMSAELGIPEGVQAEVVGPIISVRGPLGELKREFPICYIKISKDADKIKLATTKSQMRAMVGTWKSHIKNMMAGVREPYVYKLKVCSSHFPMSIKLQGNELSVQNFCGEHSPRKIKIPQGVKIKIEGDIIIAESSDIELAGRAAMLIEQKVHVKHKDRRVFQDGIYIIEKAGKRL